MRFNRGLRRACVVVFAGIAPFVAHAADECASTVAGLRALLGDESFALQWRETSMDDDKPLMLVLEEREGALFLAFVKSGSGLWGEGPGMVCRAEGRIEAAMPRERLRLGSAAPWTLRYAFANGARLTLTRVGADGLRVEAAGWSGVFARYR